MSVTPESARASDALFRELYPLSRAAEYGLTFADFAQLLSAVAAKYVPAAAPAEATRLYESLHLEELALARACANGHEHAWEVFLTRYRARLYEMAGAIAREDNAARELADSLYAELYGLNTRDGQRLSKLTYYSGRGSLEGWLRTLLAQEYVNRYRTHKRLVSLEEQEEAGAQFAASHGEPPVAADSRVNQVTDEALAALPAEERFILSAYFLDHRTLAEIARLLRVHESTISRRLDKITAKLRSNIVQGLQARGMSRRQAEEAMETDVRDLAVDVRTRLHTGDDERSRLTQGSEGPAFNREDSG